MKNKLMAVCDVLFVLILCFAVLLATMLVTSLGEAEVFTGYRIEFVKLGGVIVLIGGYLVYMIKTSMKSLNEMIDACDVEEEA